MPGVPYLNPFVQYAGFQFNYNAAFVSCAQEYGLQSTSALAISSFNTASISSLTVSSINGFLPGTASVISSFNTASISSLNVSSINGLVPGSGGSSSNVLKVAQINPLTIDSNSSAVLTLSAVTDPNVWWNSTSSFFKPTIAGYYFLSAQLTFNPSIPNDNELQLSIVENYASIFLATTVLGGFVFNAGDRQTLTASALHYFDGATTNVSIIGYNDTSGNLSVSTGLTTFQAFLIGGSPGAAGPAGPAGATISTFNTASISSATISSLNGWSIDSAISTIQIPSAALQNALNIVHFPDTPVSTLTWSNTSPSTLYVPLSPDTSVTYIAPTVPLGAGETGWRYTKTYSLIVPSTSGLTEGATYSIVTVGTTNWVAIGASAATIGVQFTYNGLPITGSTVGTCVSTKKISWYSRNDLFGLSLPQSNAPATAFTKANLQNAWFLVHFNADIAQQGTLAIQIDTYAYQGTNTSNAYTGRWAYSFPLQQGFGFTAGTTTNITTTVTTPRLRSGFTYLLYAGDTEPTYLSPTATQYLAGASGTFAPSQTVTANSLRNPYNIYPDYPHFGMTSCLYTSNALQPTYNGAPYTDPAAVEVAAIYLNTNSTSPPSGTGQTVVDFNVLAMGYCGTTSSNIAFNYSNVFI